MKDLAEKYQTLCKTLTVSFKNCGYTLRPRAGAGLWLVPLIPTVLSVSTLKQILRGGERPLSHVYFASCAVSCGLLISTVLYILRFIPKYGQRVQNYYFALPATGTLLFLLLTQNVYSHNLNDYERENAWFRKSCGLSRSAHILTGFVLSLLGGLLSTYGILAGLPTLLTLAPSCFTLGEAVIVVHSLIIFLYSSAVNICHVAFSHVSLLIDMDISFEVATVILQIGVVCVLLMIAVLLAYPFTREPPVFYMVFGLAILAIITALHCLLGGSPLLWILYNVTRNQQTFNVVLCWVFCSILGCVSVVQQVLSGRQASTSQRKVFHILAVIVFGSGFLYAPDLLYLASGVCFSMFLVLEASRILHIPPFSEILKNGFTLYCDEKDNLIALTPMYLLGGMSASLWLTPLEDFPIPPSQLLPYMAGLLSIGVGDTAASYFGSNYGRTKWTGSNRTVEGTVACFLSQASLVLLLAYFDVLPDDLLSLLRSFGAIAIVSFIEAKTDQVDNIVLPLIMYILTY